MFKFPDHRINSFSFDKEKLITLVLILLTVLFLTNIALAKLNKLELGFIKSNLNIPTIPELSQLVDVV